MNSHEGSEDMPTIIAQELGQYLQGLGEGTLGANIFIDMLLDAPHDAISIHDTGGATAFSAEPPETWREIYVQVRRKDPQDGYAAIWRVLNHLLYPSAGFINVGTNQYTAQLQEIPSIIEQDDSGRYLFGFRLTVYAVDPTDTDPWLEALAKWTESLLSTLTTTFAESWTVYRGIWPSNKRPSVTWSLAGIEVQEKTQATFEVRKRIVGHILGSSPNEQIAVALQMVQELRSAIKLLLDAANKRYMTVINAAADVKANALTAGQISLTLSRLTARPAEEAPLMAGVHHVDNLKP